jgi:hypothetical protein
MFALLLTKFLVSSGFGKPANNNLKTKEMR